MIGKWPRSTIALVSGLLKSVIARAGLAMDEPRRGVGVEITVNAVEHFGDRGDGGRAVRHRVGRREPAGIGRDCGVG